jgi:ribonucleoside-diphosphate reductase alpha chain
MKFARHFTAAQHDPYAAVTFADRPVEIREEDGSVVFSGVVKVPQHWSQTACDLLASKYLWRGNKELAPEREARQAFDRMTRAWAFWGDRLGLFESPDQMQAYTDEMRFMLVHQIGSPNSPQWFNTGLHAAYGVTGPAQGHFYVDTASAQVRASTNSLEHPQAHACFIQSVKDTLVGEGGIMDLWSREARLFKFGSGSGTNFSSLRAEGEPLAGGGVSSGLLSFLRIGDVAAGAIRSGGTTRRAAKMVVVDADHPDVLDFVQWKAKEERKVSALIAGSHVHRLHLKQVWNACFSQGSFSRTANAALAEAVAAARGVGIVDTYIQATIDCASRGESGPEFAVLDTDWRHEAYQSVSGQNSNNSIRVPQAFLEAVQANRLWPLRRRSDAQIAREIPARHLWDQIARSAWECADPGLQFETTINDWHTCPADGPIRASNPCAEYLFIDDTGCNLASLNLLKFYDAETGVFNTEAFAHAVHLWTITLEITVAMAGYPSETVARRSHEFRTLGLGFANLGALLMAMGVPYASSQAAAITASITALMTGEAYCASAQLAAALGPFARFAANRDNILRILRNHRRALEGQRDFEGLHTHPPVLQTELAPTELVTAAKAAWNRALESAQRYGLRNAQVTAIAPTGTIGLVMDCDTMGIEPEFALLKFKKLAGGGTLRIANRGVPLALRRLGYTPAQIAEIETYFHAQAMLEGAPHLKPSDYPIFDCANRCGANGKRVLDAEAHLQVVAAAQPFVSGGVSKTVNLPETISVQEIASIYERAWKLGLKAVSLYRSGCKLSQPLGSVRDKDDPSCVECG